MLPTTRFTRLFNVLLTATVAFGGSIAQAAAPAPTVKISANPAVPKAGEQSRITWSTTNATACTGAGNWSGGKPLSGSKNTAGVTANLTFRLTCTGAGGSATSQVIVTVAAGGSTGAAPTVVVTASPKAIASGGHTLISWSATNATACTATGDWTGSQPLSGAKNTGSLTTDEVFALTCTGPGGRASQSATVTVATASAPTGTATLTWSAPAKNTNGSPVTPLAGYHLFYGELATALNHSISISGANSTSYEITGLAAGTWYFAVAADATDGAESAKSAIGSLTL